MCTYGVEGVECVHVCVACMCAVYVCMKVYIETMGVCIFGCAFRICMCMGVHVCVHTVCGMCVHVVYCLYVGVHKSVHVCRHVGVHTKSVFLSVHICVVCVNVCM